MIGFSEFVVETGSLVLGFLPGSPKSGSWRRRSMLRPNFLFHFVVPVVAGQQSVVSVLYFPW